MNLLMKFKNKEPFLRLPWKGTLKTHLSGLRALWKGNSSFCVLFLKDCVCNVNQQDQNLRKFLQSKANILPETPAIIECTPKDTLTTLITFQNFLRHSLRPAGTVLQLMLLQHGMWIAIYCVTVMKAYVIFYNCTCIFQDLAGNWDFCW